LLVSAKGDEEAEEVVRALAAYGFEASTVHGEGGNRTVVLVRAAASSSSAGLYGRGKTVVSALAQRVVGRRS
jgi:hypothetical protein